MGCISSKLMCRSLSFQEDVHQRFYRTANANSSPVLEEVIITSNSRDQLLALVCTANTVVNKLRSGSFNSESKPAILPPNSEIIRTEELVVSAEQGVDEKQMQAASPKVVGSSDINRSKSCHWCPESFDGAKEDRYDDWCNRGMVRARSIHTVEEYDAMVEKFRLSSIHDSANIVQLGHSKSLSDMSQQTGFQEMHHQSRLKKNNLVEEPSRDSSSTKEFVFVEDAAKDENMFENKEKGFKRKAIAKGLESLRIPPAIEFPSIASLTECLRVESPGDYVTPKFGCYFLPISSNITANEFSDGVVFNPELVAAIEESMQQLEEEQEIILKQMSENLEGESTNEKETHRGEPTHTTDHSVGVM